MQNQIISFINHYFWLLVIGALLAVVLIFTSLQSSCSEYLFDKKVDTIRTESNKATQQAANAAIDVSNYESNRQTEDQVREQTIKPKLETARRHSQTSQAELESSRQKYENEKASSKLVNASSADNCVKLHKLFPDENFEYCQ